MKKIIILLFSFFVFIIFFYFLKNRRQEIISPLRLLTSPTPTLIPSVNVGLVGDLGLGRYITSIARQKKDFSWSFSGVSQILQQNDFNLANLESPIISTCPEGKTGTFTFCGDAQFLPQLKTNKFILNLANNHILNYGQDGLNQTKSFLENQNIGYVFSHNPISEFYQTKINGITFGFLGFDLISYPNFDQSEIIKLITKYNPQVDWLIVSIHWGNEYLPTAESWRIKLAHQMVDAGADIIHGHHPHVIQNQEIYKTKPIYYSLGNFIFDQNWSKETSVSEIINITLTKDNISNTTTIPLIIKYNSRPELVN
jgi:gamma-polyglutamate biosynthesis protein CapA